MSEAEKRNAYDCGTCGATRVYRYVDQGTTPMFVRCACGDRMTSRMHRSLPPPNVPATHEWYRPLPAEWARLSEAWQAYLNNGGLKDRKVTE